MEELYDIYYESRPDFRVSRETFWKMLGREDWFVLRAEDEGRLAGFAMIKGSSVALMCVLPEYRGRGHGSDLLRRAEERIAARGHKSAFIGRGEKIITQGVPVPDCSPSPFFTKRGYTGDWYTVSMVLETAGLDINSMGIPPAPMGVSFRIAAERDLPRLSEAVTATQPEWLDEIFENFDGTQFIAVKEGDVLGFESLSLTGGLFAKDGEPLATIGCVGVTPAARNSGIGRRIVAEGCKRLKAMGASRIQIRYVTLVDWYAAIGFKVTDWHWMAEKRL